MVPRLGRPRLLTENLKARICESLEVGNSLSVACASNSVQMSTMYKWLARGRREDAIIRAGLREQPAPREADYFYCFHAIQKSVASCEEQLVATIANAARDDWHAAAWLVERRAPQRWGPAQRQATVDLEQEMDKACNRIIAAFPQDVAEAVLEVIQRAPDPLDDPTQSRVEKQLTIEVEAEQAHRERMKQIGAGRRKGNPGARRGNTRPQSNTRPESG